MPLPSQAHVYCNVNQQKPQSYWDYKSYDVNWGNQDDYQIVKTIGQGSYGNVFMAFHMSTLERCAIKVLKPIEESEVKKEIKILQNLKHGTNVIQLLDVVRYPVTQSPAIIMEYVKTNLKEVYQSFDDAQSRFYLYELLKAIDYTHSMGIIHRDLKPQNIMIDLQMRKLCLVDWGFAAFYHPLKEYSVSVGSRHYKGPELLLDYRMYNYALDIWSLGCIFASMIFKKDPFFPGTTNTDQLVQIARILGTGDLRFYIRTFKIKISKLLNDSIGRHPKQRLHRLKNKENEGTAVLGALDLLEKFLRYDHEERMSASNALCHSYFYPVVEEQRRMATSAQMETDPKARHSFCGYDTVSAAEVSVHGVVRSHSV